MIKKFTLLLLLASLSCFAEEGPSSPNIKKASIGYTKSPYVDDEAWEAVQPHLLPYTHPLRKNLDKIFQNGRPTKTKLALIKAGFKMLSAQGNHLYPVKHPKLKGVILKVYTDYTYTEYHRNSTDWKKYLKRMRGAEMIRDEIAKNPTYKRHFVVAKKWLYPLPPTKGVPSKKNYKRRNFVLVAEDLNLVSKEGNLFNWKVALTKEQLESLFFICRDLGLQDSIRPANVWWTKKRKIAFVDTEQFEHWPIGLRSLYKHMPDKLKSHLDYLVETKGNGLMFRGI